MSPETTYSAFRCNDSIVVFHQHGHGTPQALIIFREPKRIALHDKKLIALYGYSQEAETLLDDPQHDAAEILNVIALLIKNQGKAACQRRMKALAWIVAGALLASSVWLMARDGKPSFSSVSTGMSVPPPVMEPSQVLSVPQTDRMKVQSPAATANVFSHAGVTETQNMQDILHDSRNALPASPSEALQPSVPTGTPPAPTEIRVDKPAAAQPATPSQPARLQMADVLKRSADRGMFTIPLSSGHERTLYAFLDPTCAVCRSMEPAIEQLAQKYNVIIFPVSVVNDGGNAVEKIVPLLCQKEPARRATGWRALFHADAGMPVPGQEESLPVDAECATSAAAVVGVNDTGFRRFGFAGTPTVLTDTGLRLATGMLAEPAKIDHFLKITDAMTPDQADSFVSSLSLQE